MIVVLANPLMTSSRAWEQETVFAMVPLDRLRYILEVPKPNSKQIHIMYHISLIIESVDSICRDSADTQYMLIQTNSSKSPKQLTYKPL